MRDVVRVVVALLVRVVVAVVVAVVVGVLRWQPLNVPSMKDASAWFSVFATVLQPSLTFSASPTVQDTFAAIVPREYASTAVTNAFFATSQSFSFTRMTEPSTSGPHATWPLLLAHLAISLLNVGSCVLHVCREANATYATPWFSMQEISP